MLFREKNIFWYAEATPHGGGGEAEIGMMEGRHMLLMMAVLHGRRRVKYLILVS